MIEQPQCSPACSEQHTYTPPCQLTPAPTPVAHATPCGPNVCGVVTHAEAEAECDHDSQVIEHEGVAYWACLKCGKNHGPVDAPAPEPGLREQVAGRRGDYAAALAQSFAGSEDGRLERMTDAALAVRDAELQQLRERLRLVAGYADAWFMSGTGATRECGRTILAALRREQPARPAFADVKGRCPACGWTSLFLGDGGYVTCSRIDCPEPDAASTLLERDTRDPS